MTVATCSGCAALAGAGILTTAAGVAMMAHGAYDLGDDLSRLENPGRSPSPSNRPRGGRPVPEPVNPKKRDEKWLERHGVDPHDMPLC